MRTGQTNQIKFKVFILTSALTLFWTIIVIRLFFIQVIHSNIWQRRCRNQAENRVKLPPIRGTIYDRYGDPLTVDVIQYSLAAHPYLIRDKQHTAQKIAEILEQQSDNYLALLSSKSTFVGPNLDKTSR